MLSPYYIMGAKVRKKSLSPAIGIRNFRLKRTFFICLDCKKYIIHLISDNFSEKTKKNSLSFGYLIKKV